MSMSCLEWYEVIKQKKDWTFNMSENMEIVSKRLVNLEGDNTISNQITDFRIENIFLSRGYNHLKLKTIFECLKITSIEKIAINEIFWDFKYVHKFQLIDVMLYLLQFSDNSKILKILNDEMLKELKNEIKSNNNRVRALEVK